MNSYSNSSSNTNPNHSNKVCRDSLKEFVDSKIKYINSGYMQKKNFLSSEIFNIEKKHKTRNLFESIITPKVTRKSYPKISLGRNTCSLLVPNSGKTNMMFTPLNKVYLNNVENMHQKEKLLKTVRTDYSNHNNLSNKLINYKLHSNEKGCNFISFPFNQPDENKNNNLFSGDYRKSNYMSVKEECEMFKKFMQNAKEKNLNKKIKSLSLNNLKKINPQKNDCKNYLDPISNDSVSIISNSQTTNKKISETNNSMESKNLIEDNKIYKILSKRNFFEDESEKKNEKYSLSEEEKKKF